MRADMGSGAESVEDTCTRLRAKYSTREARDEGRVTGGVVMTADDDDAFRQGGGTRSEREVRCCPKCQGQRELREEYNFRIIYRECDECDGEGTLVLDSMGKRVVKVCFICSVALSFLFTSLLHVCMHVHAR